MYAEKNINGNAGGYGYIEQLCFFLFMKTKLVGYTDIHDPRKRMRREVGVYIMAFLYVVAGINHALIPDFYIRMVPPYVPEAEWMVVISGAAEILLALALPFPRLQRLAAWGIILLLFAVFPANIYMATNYADFHISPWFAYGRLPLQFLLIWWAWMYTRESKKVKAKN